MKNSKLNALFAMVQRREPIGNVPHVTPAMRNVRPFIDTTGHAPAIAPDPVRDGDFTNVGRPWGRAQIPIQVSMSIASIQAVSEQNFGYIGAIENPELDVTASLPMGRQLAWRERTNIDRSGITAYGSLFSLNPPNYYP